MTNKEAHTRFTAFQRIADDFNEHGFYDYSKAELDAVYLVLKQVDELFILLNKRIPSEEERAGLLPAINDLTKMFDRIFLIKEEN